jgi:hypothetical protein
MALRALKAHTSTHMALRALKAHTSTPQSNQATRPGALNAFD